MSQVKTRLDIKVFGIGKEITGDKNYTAPIQKAKRKCYFLYAVLTCTVMKLTILAVM